MGSKNKKQVFLIGKHLNYWSFFKDFLFPKRCVSCGLIDTFLCYKCSLNIIEFSADRCIFCLRIDSLGGVCLKCKKETGVKIAMAACFYKEGPARDLVNALKFEGKYEVAKVIADIIANKIKNNLLIIQGCKYIVPLPLDKKRYLERGYNQTFLIAKDLAKETGLEVIDLLTKEARRPQVGLTKKERKKNIERAFRLKLGKQLPKRVILLDDVITTGSTIKEAVKALKKAGVKEIRVISFSRD